MLSPEAQQEAMSHLELAFQNEITTAEEGALLFSPERSSGQVRKERNPGAVHRMDPK